MDKLDDKIKKDIEELKEIHENNKLQLLIFSYNPKTGRNIITITGKPGYLASMVCYLISDIYNYSREEDKEIIIKGFTQYIKDLKKGKYNKG